MLIFAERVDEARSQSSHFGFIKIHFVVLPQNKSTMGSWFGLRKSMLDAVPAAMDEAPSVTWTSTSTIESLSEDAFFPDNPSCTTLPPLTRSDIAKLDREHNIDDYLLND